MGYVTGSGASFFVVRYRIEESGALLWAEASCVSEPCLFRLAAEEEASLASLHSRLLQLGYPQACMSDDNRDLQAPEIVAIACQCTSRRGDRVTLNPEGQPPAQPGSHSTRIGPCRLRLGVSAGAGRSNQNSERTQCLAGIGLIRSSWPSW